MGDGVRPVRAAALDTSRGRTLAEWERVFEDYLARTLLVGVDAAHDLAHVQRVVATARALAHAERADLWIVIPAAWLHDCVTVPKHAPERAHASRLAAKAAGTFLREVSFPAARIPAIEHAIHAHSFSAAVEPRTPEAKVVQDADRLDALGAVGIARTLMLGGTMGSALYDPGDPLALARPLDDRRFVVDHFFTKLLRLAEQIHTASGRAEAERRTAFMRSFLAQLEHEIGAEPPPSVADSAP